MNNYFKTMAAASFGSALTLAASYYSGAFQPRVVTLTRAEAADPAPRVIATGARSTAELVDFSTTADRVTAGVVHIKSTYGRPVVRGNPRGIPQNRDMEQFRQFFGDGFEDMLRQGPQGPQAASGSGVIISKEGYIVTNNHVVENATELEVVLSDKRVAKAKVIGTDPSTDLAVIQIKEDNLLPIAFGNSDLVKVGQWVAAVGNPLNLESTLTVGVISAKSRSIRILQDSLAVESFIQTDAAVNPGNSGGALVNTAGDLVGINTAIASPTGSYAGYAFAVPSNIVSKVVEDLIAFGVVQRGLLGVNIGEVNRKLVGEKDLKVNDGVYVGRVLKGSAAEAGGVKEGDVITNIDNMPITSVTQLQETVARKRPGDRLALAVNRNGKAQNLNVVLKNRAGKAEAVKRQERTVTSNLGLVLGEVKATDLKRANVKVGVQVKKISEGIVQAQTDMREGFIITKVDKKPVKNEQEVLEAIKSATSGVMLEGVYPDYPGSYYYAFGAKEE